MQQLQSQTQGQPQAQSGISRTATPSQTHIPTPTQGHMPTPAAGHASLPRQSIGITNTPAAMKAQPTPSQAHAQLASQQHMSPMPPQMNMQSLALPPRTTTQMATHGPTGTVPQQNHVQPGTPHNAAALLNMSMSAGPGRPPMSVANGHATNAAMANMLGNSGQTQQSMSTQASIQRIQQLVHNGSLPIATAQQLLSQLTNPNNASLPHRQQLQQVLANAVQQQQQQMLGNQQSPQQAFQQQQRVSKRR